MSFGSGLSTVQQCFQTALRVWEAVEEVILWRVNKSKITRCICVWKRNVWCVGGTCKRPSEVFLDITFSTQSWNFICASSGFWFRFPFEEGKNQFITSKFCHFSLVRFCLLMPLQQSQLSRSQKPRCSYLVQGKSGRVPRKASKTCTEMLSVVFRCKRLTVPCCAPIPWVKQSTFSFSGMQTTEAESFLVVGEQQIQKDPTFLWNWAFTWVTAWNWRIWLLRTEAFQCLFISMPSHWKPAYGLASELQTSLFFPKLNIYLQVIFSLFNIQAVLSYLSSFTAKKDEKCICFCFFCFGLFFFNFYRISSWIFL